MRSQRDASAGPARPLARVRRLLVAAFVAAAVVYIGALAVLSLEPVQRLARERIVAELRSRLGRDVTLGPEVLVDPLFRVTVGPLVVPASEGALLRVERVTVRASATALLAGRLEPASVRLRGVRVGVGPRARDLRALLARSRRGAPERAASGEGTRASRARAGARLPTLRLRDVVVSVPIRGRTIEVGPFDADVTTQRGEEPSVRADLRLPGGGRGAIEADRVNGAWRVAARLLRLGPGDVPEALRDGPVAFTGGTVDVTLEGSAQADLARADASLRVVAEGLFVGGERVSLEPIGPLRTAIAVDVAWDGAERRLVFTRGRVTVGDGLHADLAGEARLGGGIPFTFSARAEGVDYARALDALPPALAPPPAAPRPAGTLDARLDAEGPLLAPAAWGLSASLDLSRMREVSRRGRPVALRSSFRFTPTSGAGPAPATPRAFEVAAANPRFVPIGELPEHVVRAITTSEDAGFFAHHGFDFAELANAFAAGAERGRVVRGGSTITQQLAKNLYLSREKTLARKVREAAITIALEATVPKSRLLEIYLNIVEWGPGVYGIGPAAQHWFEADARSLTPKQAAFLASIIPSPLRYHGMRARGGVSENWEQHVNELLLKMAEQGALTGDELSHALGETIVFAGGEGG